ncbi:putative N-acetyltransferase YjaB [Lentilactobacillus sunkii]|jgi:putative acetyltransferase|uniref:Putative N-acetyltransferase YjaB n=1 Tax=Lentilactobacillus sunkii TaxID=481719 RepID=A0A1E7XG66_9LACO|nr:GNAT family N-acetyltransferase [Lentilactobacillus sunkii]OFA12087.1 putative N-acetyltransferase YjaB [Lentilactobacillus sunkii]
MIEHVKGISGSKLDEVARIWLDGNLEAHSFIDPNYWKNYYDTVKQDIGHAEMFIFEDNGHVAGFLGMDGHYIAGLFVASEYRGQGIGTQLLESAKQTRSELTLSVYEKNANAYKFYLKNGFHETIHKLDRVTSEFAVNMKWEKRGSEDGR